jgi:hypothetical protein
MIIEIAVVVVVIVAIVPVVFANRASRRRQLAVISGRDPGAYVFTFSSNRWYQNALIELQRQKIIDPEMVGDDSRPLVHGPRWVSASSSGIRIMRGYDEESIAVFAWASVGRITSEMHSGYRSTTAAVTVNILGAGGDVSIVFYSPSADVTTGRSLKQAQAVADELNRIRFAPPSATLV